MEDGVGDTAKGLGCRVHDVGRSAHRELRGDGNARRHKDEVMLAVGGGVGLVGAGCGGASGELVGIVEHIGNGGAEAAIDGVSGGVGGGGVEGVACVCGANGERGVVGGRQLMADAAGLADRLECCARLVDDGKGVGLHA